MAGISVMRDAPTEPMPTTTVFSAMPDMWLDDAVLIAYGYPSVDLFEAERRGELILGGRLVGPESPEYECRTCRAALPGRCQRRSTIS